MVDVAVGEFVCQCGNMVPYGLRCNCIYAFADIPITRNKEISVENIELNLGPFIDCMDKLGDNDVAQYRLLNGNVVSYNHRSELCRVVESSDNMVTVCLLTLALAVKEDTLENRHKLIRAIELKILSMVYEVVDAAKISLASLEALDRVKIPIKPVTLRSDEFGILRIFVEVGICAFEDEAVIVS